MRRPVLLITLVAMCAGLAAQSRRPPAKPAGVPAAIDVTVHEGTSMSVAVSPDGRTLATDMQGSIWTLPAAGGAMTRITDVFNDARQPMWSPDGRTIAFFAYRDGGYDIWTIDADGSNQRKLTWGTFDDLEPAWSHDGTRVAFSSDRGNPLGSDYNIWVLDTRSGAITQVTRGPDEDIMPTWSPDDSEIAFASSRDRADGLWVVNLATGAERKVRTVAGARVDAPSWGPRGQLLYHVTANNQTRLELDGKAVTGAENVFAFRASWASASEFVYVADGRIRKRSVAGLPMQTVDFSATLQVTRPQYARRVRDFASIAPRKALGVVRPVISPDGTRRSPLPPLATSTSCRWAAPPSMSRRTQLSTPTPRGRRTDRRWCIPPTRPASTCSSGSAT